MVPSTRFTPRIRLARPGDAAFIAEMLAVAADWRPGTTIRDAREVLAEPSLAHYAVGWPAEGDVGVVADAAGTVGPVGAAWWRFMPEADPGYGFVATSIPEVSIGVRPGHRRNGTGRRLMTALLGEARARALPGLSLSAEDDNPAVTLYRSLGFAVVSSAPGSVTMLWRPQGRGWQSPAEGPHPGSGRP